MRTTIVCLFALALAAPASPRPGRPGRWTSTSSTSKAATRRCSWRRPANRCSSTRATAAPPRCATPIASWPRSKDAGLTQIDHLITTHWHGDHFGGHGGARRAHPDPPVHRPRRERAAGRGRPTSSCRRRLSGALREGDAHGREAGRQDRGRRPRLAHRRVGGRGDQDAAARRGQAESVLRRVSQTAGRRSDRERAVGRQRHHVRQVPGRCTSAI